MIKNILMENMRRFKTKNLNETGEDLEEGVWDITKLYMYRKDFEMILTPEQSESVINARINSMIENMGGPKDAAKLMLGALESIDKLKSLIKLVLPNGPIDKVHLNLKTLSNIVNRLPFDDQTKQKLISNIEDLARELGIRHEDENGNYIL